jgi:hypothetical protein
VWIIYLVHILSSLTVIHRGNNALNSTSRKFSDRILVDFFYQNDTYLVQIILSYR